LAIINRPAQQIESLTGKLAAAHAAARRWQAEHAALAKQTSRDADPVINTVAKLFGAATPRSGRYCTSEDQEVDQGGAGEEEGVVSLHAVEHALE
jgi:hypothetical protein